jgi:inosose dehydratase
MVDPQYLEAAIRDMASLGFYGIELFGNQIVAMEGHGGLGALLEKYNLPLISAYCGTNLSDPAQRKDSIAKMMEWAKARQAVQGQSDRRRSQWREAQHLRFQSPQGRHRGYAQ